MSYPEVSELYSDFTQGPAEASGTGRAFLCWDWGYLCLLRVLGLPPVEGSRPTLLGTGVSPSFGFWRLYETT